MGLGGATTQQVSEIADVPWIRVYDAIQHLREELIDVQQSSSKQFWPLSTKTAAARLQQKTPTGRMC